MPRSTQPFKDILEARRHEFSNFMWVSRELNPMLPCKQPIKLAPKQHKIDVLNSILIEDIIEKISKERGVSAKEIKKQVKHILDEIGYKRQLTIIRWLGLFLTKVVCKVCTGIYVNEDSVARLKSQMGNTPIIYVPSHRSYADFILMSYVLFTYNIEIPAIAAGMDFHGMWGMGRILRDTGAFFMRRTYNDDNLYWETFKQYVHQLVTKGEGGIEFFIEGTRSRSCKSLQPKYGLLSMIIKAFVTGEVPDILFVPINISYDRLLEEKLFAFEHLGVPKPKESTSGFLKSLSMIKEKYGKIYFDFGAPISAREVFSGTNRTKHGIKPIHMQALTPEERDTTTLLAEKIVYMQQKLATINTFNLVAVVLTNNLIRKQDIMRLDELTREVIWFRNVIESFGGMTDLKYPTRNVAEALEVHKNLVRVDENSNVTLLQNAVVLGTLNQQKLKGHCLSEQTMTVAIPFVMLQIYVNPTLHYLITHAILVNIFRNYGTKHISKERLLDEYTFLRSLFSNEFALFESRSQEEFLLSLNQLVDLKAVNKEGETEFSLGSNEKLQTLLCNIFDPFLFSYYTVCSAILNLNQKSCDEKTLLASSQEKLEELINAKEEFVHPYTLSLDTLTNCLQSLVKLAILRKSRSDGSNVYEINMDALYLIIPKIKIYAQKISKEEPKTIQMKNKL